MTRLEAVAASPLGYAKRGTLYATARQTFVSYDGVLAPCLWPGGLSGTDDWEPVLPEVGSPPSEGISEGSSQRTTSVEVTSPEAGEKESGKVSDGETVAPVAAPTPPVLETPHVKLGRESLRHRSKPRR